MITEQARVEQNQNIIEDRKKWLRQIIAAAARYERLNTDKDFLDVLEDLKKVADIHKREVDGYVRMMSTENNFFKKLRLVSVVDVHQIRHDQIMDAVNYPSRILHEAKQAREELAKINEQEKQHGIGTDA